MVLTRIANPLSVEGPFLFVPNIDVVFLGERHEGVRVVGPARKTKL